LPKEETLLCQAFARIYLFFLISLTGLLLVACQRQDATESRGGKSEAVTIYVSTDRVFSEPILQAYEQKTGVKVNAVYDTE
jgi:iron(III) transport system substrate-binding protein